MKVIQNVLLATMISSAVLLLIGSAGTVRPDGYPGEMKRTYTYEGSAGIAATHAGQPAEDLPASPGGPTTRNSGAFISYNTGAGYRGRPQNPLKYDKTMQNNSHQSRIVQFPMQPIDLTINPTVTPVHVFE
jgi:hypothetical protein